MDIKKCFLIIQISVIGFLLFILGYINLVSGIIGFILCINAICMGHNLGEIEKEV